MIDANGLIYPPKNYGDGQDVDEDLLINNLGFSLLKYFDDEEDDAEALKQIRI